MAEVFQPGPDIVTMGAELKFHALNLLVECDSEFSMGFLAVESVHVRHFR